MQKRSEEERKEEHECEGVGKGDEERRETD
jgi:hypothetical protein